ncbi:MAG: polysaccharide biosynthesis protein [Candidatus Latescibacteria bacterium]|nr:polysaccharide biosynthesis protein [Candidatus Latescibacterota bacterium]NIM21089.1 polysaccharide biosynthesis protein [Candidatus Latescibacterota bacterium]NIM65224.1 polysaccharide biosynthesis protein [Candidatus Latescibacterota bacterium]NIO01739.1 polysaccharide biosynthesis protein [Candidatus Latescibacterota bacterium]NIO28256.1 polysaccharide biosynthesis protein [Candidatus Latescibacterota bacterium]
MAKRVLIIGAGEAGRMILQEITQHPESGFEVAGFLDDEPSLKGRKVDGIPVLGQCADLVEVVRTIPVDEAIISVPSAEREFIRRIISLCRDAGLNYKIVPGLIEIIRGPARLDQIREVHPEDLLGRETVEFDEKAISEALAGRSVLVTGAGGSIGGEICRQVGRFDLEALLLLGRGENQIYDIEYEMRTRHPNIKTEALIADIRDEIGLRHLFERVRPQYVFHAAAHKHVHYMEAFPEEAVKNNVFGTANIINVCRESGVERLVMLSTDKAVEPEGVMGATKRLAEYLMANGARQAGGARLMTVRFGNVLGSRGSVVPLFIDQIRKGGPVTVSSPEASRFFMTLKEACMLVIQASILGKGGEIFILQMGQPIKIMEIAKDLIALHGLRPNIDVEVELIGLRPGEKLHESLLARAEAIEDSPHEYILTTRATIPDGLDIDEVLGKLKGMTDRGDGEAIKHLLNEIIPDACLPVREKR